MVKRYRVSTNYQQELMSALSGKKLALVGGKPGDYSDLVKKYHFICTVNNNFNVQKVYPNIIFHSGNCFDRPGAEGGDVREFYESPQFTNIEYLLLNVGINKNTHYMTESAVKHGIKIVDYHQKSKPWCPEWEKNREWAKVFKSEKFGPFTGLQALAYFCEFDVEEIFVCGMDLYLDRFEGVTDKNLLKVCNHCIPTNAKFFQKFWNDHSFVKFDTQLQRAVERYLCAEGES